MDDVFGGGQAYATKPSGADGGGRAKSFHSDLTANKFKRCYLFSLFMTISIGTL